MEKKNFFKMKVAIVIPTKNRFYDLMGVVESLLKQSIQPCEIIIVYDDKEIDEKEINNKNKAFQNLIIENNYKSKIHHLKGIGKGANPARNIGIKKATADIILVLDDDVVLDKDFIKAILEVYFQFPSAGGVGGVIQNYRKLSFLKRLFKRMFFLNTSDKNKGYLLPSGYPCHLESCDIVTNVEVLSGCCMSYIKEVFGVFHFNEDLKGYAYLDDVDFSYRVSRKYKLFITPKAKLIHNSETKLFDENLNRVKVYYHYLVFKKLLPVNIITIFAFTISIIGDFIQSAIISFMNRTSKPLIGYLKGLQEIIHHIRSGL